MIVDKWPVLLFHWILMRSFEKEKLKGDGNNYTDWVLNLRIILIAAHKNYVLEAPLGARPIAGSDADIMNIWQAWYDDYLIV